MEKLLLNNTYLLSHNGIIESITILSVTNKAYKIRWNEHTNKTILWELKESFMKNYSIIENITNHCTLNDLNNVKTALDTDPTTHEKIIEIDWVDCPNCNGIGTVPNPNSTVMIKTCPVCYGNTKVPKTKETYKTI